MNSDTTDLVLEHLRAIRSDVADLRSDVQLIKYRITGVEDRLVTMQKSLDHSDDRLARIEVRLNLAEA